MSGGITVKEFKHIPGVNDAEYIEKLEELREIDKGIINAAVAKVKRLSAQLKEQPTQTNCEYCHTDCDGYVFPLEKNSHAFIDRDRIVLKANGWRGEAKIKYCPMCGRRLTDE